MPDKRIDDIERRLREIERYMPAIRETFATEIGPPFPSMEDLIKAQMRENMSK